MLRRSWSGAAGAVILTLAVPHPAAAQAPTPSPAAAAAPTTSLAPTLVGAAVVVLGLVVGGDTGTVIAIGGAGLGLFGLYIWQRGD
jgi:hypothetical protein